MLKKISMACLTVLLIAGCSRVEPPSEVIYARPLSPYHVVKPGDTTLSVAQKYDMPEDELIRINRLKAGCRLVPGQRLLVHIKANVDEPTVAPSEEGDVQIKPLEVSSSALTTTAGAAGAGAGAAVMQTGSTSSAVEDLEPAPSSVPAEEVKPAVVASEALSYAWPVQGEIIQSFGQKLPDGSLSEGINIRAAANLPVKAAADGVVKDAGGRIPAYGNMIVLKHSDGKMSIYAHLNEMLVKQPGKGQVITVKKGQVIGRVGKTGVAKEPQLYFQVRDKALKPMDPTSLLP